MTTNITSDVMQDLRRLGRPPSFSGQDHDFQGFRFCLKTYMMLVSKRAEETLIVVWGTDGQLGGRGARRAAQLAVASDVTGEVRQRVDGVPR